MAKFHGRLNPDTFKDMSESHLKLLFEETTAALSDIQHQLERYNQGVVSDGQDEDWRKRAVYALHWKRRTLSALRIELTKRRIEREQEGDDSESARVRRLQAFVSVAKEVMGDEWAQEVWKEAKRLDPDAFAKWAKYA